MTIKNLFAKLSLSPSLWRGLGGCLFLLLGSSNLMAQSTDPFGTFDESDYYGDMSMTVKVMMNGSALTGDVVLAAYSGTQLRGKAKPNKTNTELFYLTVYGDDEESIFFKVYTDGHVIETDPGNLKFQFYGVIGKTSAPYIVNLPAPVVTTPSTEGWATVCVPFNAEVPAGVTMWNVTGFDKGQLVLSKATGTILPKDTPVLLQSDGLTKYEWLSRVSDGDVNTAGSLLKGTTADTDIAANSVMTLGHSKESGAIGFWLYSGTTIPANRAYIADFPSTARGFTFPDVETTTGVATMEDVRGKMSDEVYDLMGRRVSKVQRGLYIVNGKKVVIK